MPFLNFFISFYNKTNLINSNMKLSNSYIIYLDNPDDGVYFPFQRTKILDFDILKLITNKLNFLSNFLETQVIFLNYNTTNCKLNKNDFIIKSLQESSSVVEWADRKIDITLLEKPVLFKLDDDKYFFDFEINQNFLDFSVLVKLFKIYKIKKNDLKFKDYWSFFRPFFNSIKSSDDSRAYDFSYLMSNNSFGVFLIGVEGNNNIFQSYSTNSWVLKNNQWVNPYLESYYDNDNKLLCNNFFNCGGNNHTYSCKILSNCIYWNKRFLFGASLPFSIEKIIDFEELFQNILDFSKNRIDIINLDNEKVTEEWLDLQLDLIAKKVNISNSNINVWLNDYSEVFILNSSVYLTNIFDNKFKNINITFLNWSFFKFLFYNNLEILNKQGFTLDHYIYKILNGSLSLNKYYTNLIN